MSGHVIACVALAGSGPPVPEGSLLASYDPEAHAGQGEAFWTRDPSLAHVFPTAAAAWECWRQVPKARPVREDGRPNRPLTAFTIEVRPA